MFPDNLTRTEAQARAALIQTHAYAVEVDLRGVDGENESAFRSQSMIDFTARAGGDLHLDLIADRLLSASLDGTELDPGSFAGSRLPLRVSAGPHRLSVTATCRYSRSGEGLHRFVDPADQRVYLYTQFEPAEARRVFGCFEQPDLKARFAISVIAPQCWRVVSCGVERAVTPLGDGHARWEFAETPPISTYLTAIVAGEYHAVPHTYAGARGPVEMSVLCRASSAEHLDADRIFATTTAGFAVFERHFGFPYAFGKYDQVFVPEYNGGAMENVGCVTFRDEYLFRGRVTEASYRVRDDTILHELSHMWFGDLVTMTWWDDLWLKESFATWASHWASGEFGDADAAWAAFCISMKAWALRQDQLPSSHPIAADMVDLEAVELNFDGITYAKGASVLVQLVAFVGREAFLAGVREYFGRHAYGNTTLTDLLRVLESASGRSLADWSAQWLETAGANTLRPAYEVGSDGTFTSFAVHQSAPAAWPTLRDHRLAIGLYALGESGLARTGRVELDVSGAVTRVPDLVGRPVPDLVLINDDDLTYAKVRLDPRSVATVLDHVHQMPTALSRAVCWGSTWDMCRDAELPAADYVRLALRVVGIESDLTEVTAVLQAGLKAAADYSPRPRRDEVLRTWQQGLRELITAAAPGSDHQLALARAFAAAASDPDAAGTLAAWLAGRDLPDGLVMDPEVRWVLVRHLARLGGAEEAAIAAELAADQTITGKEQAAAARTARPTAAAKAAAWHDVAEANDLPNGTHRAVCSAFWQRGQDEVLAPYVERYLEMAADISTGRGSWAEKGTTLRTNALRDLFPQPADPGPFLERLDRWLAEAELTDFVRRVIAERRDDAVRALRCQQAAGPA